jgi:hypothetical protein
MLAGLPNFCSVTARRPIMAPAKTAPDGLEKKLLMVVLIVND